MRASPFFDGVRQVDLTVGEHELKFPIFYYDGIAVTATFPAKLSVLKKFLPDRRFVPARIGPGLGAVTISAFEYRDTDIGPYNELAIAIPLNYPAYRANVPFRALASGFRTGQLHAFVHHLPVTTEIARVGGVDFYNYPKFVAGIDFTESDSKRDVRLSEGEEHILSMSCARIPTPKREQLQVFSHLCMDRQPQSSEFKLNSPAVGSSLRPGMAELKLGGRHPIALELKQALVSTKAINLMYMSSFEGILYGPEHMTLPFLQWAAERWSQPVAESAK